MVSRQIYLDCRKLTERRSAHDHLENVMGLPEYYGRNLDALYDCLLEMQDCLLVLLHEDEACLAGTYGARIIRVLEEAVYENPGLKILRETTLTDL